MSPLKEPFKKDNPRPESAAEPRGGRQRQRESAGPEAAADGPRVEVGKKNLGVAVKNLS